MKVFNTTGTCRPNQHYMVDITERLEIIKGMVSRGDYFCINRSRQYGKTTTLRNLKGHLEQAGYCVFSISLENVDNSYLSSEYSMAGAFLKLLWMCAIRGKAKNLDAKCGEEIDAFYQTHTEGCTFLDLSQFFVQICSLNASKIVLLVDEVDQAAGYPSFLKLLGTLRALYLTRDEDPTFQSVVLAGVHDIKNLKLKMRPDEQHQYNSPWNIATPFDVDMSLSADGIAGMLAEYKADHNLDFDEMAVATTIRDYTSGYPFLVSRICQIIDLDRLPWNREGVLAAVNKVLGEGNTLFDDFVKKFDDHPDLVKTLKGMLFGGERYQFNYYDKSTNLALMFGFVKQDGMALAISCRLFETWLYNYFISQEKQSPAFLQGVADRARFVSNGVIDMPHLLERFVEHMRQTFSLDKDHKFLEENARQIFLTYLRPIINGIGSYHIEEQTRDHERMDVVIDYLGKQYVVELKIWRGNAYNERGEEQLCRYLQHFNLSTGYLLSFCFNKSKTPGLQPPVALNGRTLIEAIV